MAVVAPDDDDATPRVARRRANLRIAVDADDAFGFGDVRVGSRGAPDGGAPDAAAIRAAIDTRRRWWRRRGDESARGRERAAHRHLSRGKRPATVGDVPRARDAVGRRGEESVRTSVRGAHRGRRGRIVRGESPENHAAIRAVRVHATVARADENGRDGVRESRIDASRGAGGEARGRQLGLARRPGEAGVAKIASRASNTLTMESRPTVINDGFASDGDGEDANAAGHRLPRAREADTARATDAGAVDSRLRGARDVGIRIEADGI